MLASRRTFALILAGGMLVMSVVALVLAIEVGLFGFRDSWLAPYAWTSFYEEIAGAVLLLGAAVALAWPSFARQSSPVSSGASLAGR